jgi:hypothetical protein
MKIKLKSTNVDEQVVESKFDATTWHEIADKFYLFLIASGFSLDGKTLAEHFDGSDYRDGV